MSSENANDDFSLILAASVHDMKNSLGMLLGSLDEVISEMDPANQRQAKQFTTLQYEASRISAELVQLLSVYRMQKQRLPVTIDEQYVIELLEDQITRNETLFTMQGITVHLDCAEDLVWYFDGEMVAAVINDALVNASRYTKDKILVSAQITDQCLEVRISDNGPGFPRAMLGAQTADYEAQEFDRHRTNLGLYFASQIAKRHKRNDITGRLELLNAGRLPGGELVLILP
ncbi:sensor histidine kinase [Halioxenophilus aromaticivorans]|uniref:HAMP domain-containing sensor histidine kinase n=1 Tax=Halioxenophilus aromaticivorans TaxID=1306992 RepID=A0AAV3TWX0_9ALTE